MRNQLFKFIVLMAFTFQSHIGQVTNGEYFEEIDSIKIHFEIKGKGPVLFAGHPTSGKIAYQMSLQRLEEKFTIVYYDSRGVGKSEVPELTKEYFDENLLKEIDELRKYLNQNRIWLFGHSDQSGLALQYALKYPEHTEGLILSGTGYVGSWDEMLQVRANSEKYRIENSEWFKQVVKDWDYKLKHNTSTDPNGRDLTFAPLKWWCYNETSAQAVVPMFKAVQITGKRKPAKDLQKLDENFAKTQIKKYVENEKNFKDIKCDILIINGKYDTNNPKDKVLKLHYLVNSQLVILEKSGHFPWIEQPTEFFNEVDKWLVNKNSR